MRWLVLCMSALHWQTHENFTINICFFVCLLQCCSSILLYTSLKLWLWILNMILYICRKLNNLQNFFSDIISFLTLLTTLWSSNSYSQFEGEETGFVWLNSIFNTTKLVDSVLNCKMIMMWGISWDFYTAVVILVYLPSISLLIMKTAPSMADQLGTIFVVIVPSFCLVHRTYVWFLHVSWDVLKKRGLHP
jgi:hypothetical protein